MTQTISIEFEYRQKTYFALVRIKEKQPTEYHVTIMNGALEKRLYGHHIFIEEEGTFLIGPLPARETGQLRLAIGMALCRHYNKSYHANESTT